MRILQKIVIRIFSLTLLLVAMNFVYASFFLEKDLQKHSPIVNSIRAISPNSSVLYLGESSNQMYAENDVNKKTISQMLNDLLENKLVSDITKPAAHAGIYKTLLENVNLNTPINTVIVTVNLRSFAADWVFSELETPLQKEMILLQNRPPLFNRFLLSFKAYGDNNERKRFEKIDNWWEKKLHLTSTKEKTTVREWHQSIDSNWGDTNIIDRELAKNYINNFAFEITKKHPRIEDLDKIVQLAQNRNWKLIFSILPENMDAIHRLVGKDLLDFMMKNAKFIEKRYVKKKVIIVNNLTLVSNPSFIDKDFPTEHYDEKGRMIIAKKIAENFIE